MPATFNNVPAQEPLGQRRAMVRAGILCSKKLAVDIVESQFVAVRKSDGKAATGRQILDAASHDRLAR